MARTQAESVEAYLAELPEPRRAVVGAVRDLVLRHLPDGYRETMNWGMICYEVPLDRYPDTYNKQPLGYLALAAQKNHCALYLNCVYGDEQRETWLREAFEKAGKKMDMGKSCLRFRSLDDLPLDALGELIADTPPDAYIARHEAARQG